VPCQRCGAVIPDAARFCPSCGYPVSTPARTVYAPGAPPGLEEMTVSAAEEATQLHPGFGNMMLLVAIAVGLTSWGLYTSVAGRLWKLDPLG
jgi:hypothetical protein